MFRNSLADLAKLAIFLTLASVRAFDGTIVVIMFFGKLESIFFLFGLFIFAHPKHFLIYILSIKFT
jgi:hypothetical protein